MQRAHKRRISRWIAGLTITAIGAGVTGVGQPAEAFKPFTHTNTGYEAYADAVDDGHVTINGVDYPVNPTLVAALQAWPAHYNSGVVGPDGFPDLVMGQSEIHPNETGDWLAYLLDRAWAAQSDPSRTADEKGQILAFTYGYLTHAAGDVWAHTLVNEFAGETFPGVGDILTDKEDAEFALRHLIVEGYIGDATVGYDGDPASEPLDVGNPASDWSNNSTPGTAFDAPTDWIYDVLVNRNAPGAPSTSRGAAIDFFYGLRDTLSAAVSTDPQPLQDALATFEDTVELAESIFDEADCSPEGANIDDDGDGVADDGCGDAGDPSAVGRSEHVSGDCTFGVGNTGGDIAIDIAWDLVACPIALAVLGIQTAVDSMQSAFVLVTESVAYALDAVVDAYLAAWIEDIDRGLAHWGEFGVAVTKGLFDAQTLRDGQNDECQFQGGEGNIVRRDCEDSFGTVDAIFYAADPFVNEYLLSMLGAPDVVGDLRALLDEAADALDSIVGPALNPLRKVTTVIKEEAKEIVKDQIEDRWGIPVDKIEYLLDNPSVRMDLQAFYLGDTLGWVDVMQPGDRAKLDSYLGMTPHAPNTPLLDGEAFNPYDFKAYYNTMVLGRMLLLDGPQMDALLSNETGLTYSLYAAAGVRGNVMTTPLPGAGDGSDNWLRSIDADFGWRSNAAPLAGALLPADHPTGGHGNFPLWESCILRPTFRSLFDDWHLGTFNATEFPDYGDATSADPNDPAAPVTTATIGNPKFVDRDGTIYVGADSVISMIAADDYWPGDLIDLRVGVAGGSSQVLDNGAQVRIGDLGVADGPHTIVVQAFDPCRTEEAQFVNVVVDTTAPVVTYLQPTASGFDTDDLSAISYTVSDALSGVASHSVDLDESAAANDQTLDMFLLTAGVHTIQVTATDNVGNSGLSTRTFTIRATSTSLRNNVDRAYSLGLISNPKVYAGLVDKLNAAVKAHNAGKHATELEILKAVQQQLLAQIGKGINPTFANRMLGWVNDLIATHI